jgi:hypothetical protein
MAESVPDSTSSSGNNFLQSWGSCETIADFNDIVCSICKVATDLSQNIVNGRVIIYKSNVFLKCTNCDSVTHVHCHLNQAIVPTEILIACIQTVEQEGFTCINCKDEQ